MGSFIKRVIEQGSQQAFWRCQEEELGGSKERLVALGFFQECEVSRSPARVPTQH